MPKVIGIIPARYGSTRFPGKALTLILGKTLIQRTYENALLCSTLDDVVVATDDQRIFDHVQDFGGKVVMTSIDCPTGTDRLNEVITNTPQYSDADIVVNIQGDEPCVDPKTIESVVQLCINDQEAVVTTAAVKFNATTEESNDTSLVKCVLDNQGRALYFSRALIPHGKKGGPQEGVDYYRHLGIYCYKTPFLRLYTSLPTTPLQRAEDLEQLKILEHGYKIAVSIVDDISIGVDTPQDITKIEEILQNHINKASCNKNISFSQAE